MDIRILGAHNCEAKDIKCVSFLIDDILALDAGSLASSLSISEQRKLKAILITHYHYDHVRDIPILGMNLLLNSATISLFSTAPVRDKLTAHLLNGDIYPNFLERPTDNPTIKFTVIEPLKTRQIEGYEILPVAVGHSIPAVGYQVTSPEGKKVFYTGDTGQGLSECWGYISPDLLIIELTMPDKYENAARKTGHLTPVLLKQELISFREIKGYLPRILAIHINPYLEAEISAEIAPVAAELKASITLAREGMQVHL